MKIQVESFGGIVGHLRGERSDEQLTPEQTDAVATLRNNPPRPVSAGPAPRYRVTVEDEHGRHEIGVSEEDMPDALASIPGST